MSFVLNMCTEQAQNPQSCTTPTFQDTVNIIDTAYWDEAAKSYRPPCSISLDYCRCMEHRGVIPYKCR